MRIFIITMDDPVQTYDFIKYIIDNKKDQIVGLAVPKGDRMKIGKKKSKLEYVISLFLIMGLFHFIKNGVKTVMFKLQKKLYKMGVCPNPSIAAYAEKLNIPILQVKGTKDEEFLKQLRELKPDIIINQSQLFLKNSLLEIPTIGTLNRHNALLPKNRGRLTPFWVLYKGETETGVSIHFVTEELDAGEIIVQKRYSVEKNDNFNSLVKKNYEIAPKAMIEAINMLEAGANQFMENDSSKATYNTTPTLKEAWEYRKKRLF